AGDQRADAGARRAPPALDLGAPARAALRRALTAERTERLERQRDGVAHADVQRVLVDVERALVQVEVAAAGGPHAEAGQRPGHRLEVPGEVLAAHALL